jgi:hypothetical protein
MYDFDLGRCESCKLKIATVAERVTVLGLRQLCTRCYASYRELIDGLAAYVNAHGCLPDDNNTPTSSTNR